MEQMRETGKKWKISRRRFLQAAAAAGVLTGTGGFAFRIARRAQATQGVGNGESKLVRTTCSPNCTGACGMIARVENGQIKTIIRAGDYPEKEYNPRGCLKGLSMINLIYGPDRLKAPLIRTGERGSGEFREVSWEEALDYVAGKLKEIGQKYGSQSISVAVQVGGTGYVHKGALIALAAMAGWSAHHAYDQNGDLPMFWPMTFGVQTEELEPLEWINSRYIMVCGSNLLATRVPDAHFVIEARKQGAKLVVVDPNYSPTAAKADEWVRINPATDAALALGMAKVIIDEKLYDEAFIKTYTDLPLLVRNDTGVRLRAREVKATAPAAVALAPPPYRDVFVVWDGGPRAVNPEDLTPVANPALEGEYEVELVDGQRVKCKPVFQLLKEKLAEHSVSQAAQATGVPEDTIVRLARELATSGPVHIIYGASNYQWYHGDLKGRALALLVVLTGNIGKSGAGISTYAGQYRIRFKVGSWWAPEGKSPNWVPFLYVLHGPTPRIKANYPQNGIKAFITGWGNPFDQHNMANKLRQMATNGDLELIVAIDFQMTTTCQWADVVLPGVTWYEKTELVASPVHPYLQLQQPAIEPLYQCKPELWIVRELAKRLDPSFANHFFPELDVNAASEKAIELMLANGGPLVEGITLADLKKGPVRLKLPAPGHRQIPFWEQINLKQPFPPQSFPAPLEKTAAFVRSGRIEFYKEEEVFRELGEELPVYKPPFEESEYALNPQARDKYRFVLVTRNALFRVHSTHSNNPWLNEIQGNKPAVWINPDDAREKGIGPGDLVELYNDRGRVRAYAVLTPGIHRGVVIFEQGWWSRYLHGDSYNTLVYPWIKPTHEVYFLPGMWSPNSSWNECLCDVRKAGGLT